MPDPLETVVNGYEPRDDREADHQRRVRAFLGHGDPWARARPLHVTASALVLHAPSRRVLLRWHERMGRWMQVGGHGDAGEHDPWEIVRREALEETGLADLQPLAPDCAQRPVQIVIVPVPAHGDEPAHEHADVRYLLSTEHPDDATPETRGARLRWLGIDEALGEVEEDNVRTLLERAREALDALSCGP